MLFFLVQAMYPVRIAGFLSRIYGSHIAQRFLITQNDEGEQLDVAVRVGQVRSALGAVELTIFRPLAQAVDTVGQAGKPRTISGFQTHTTPVRLGTSERAEMATEEYFACVSLYMSLLRRVQF